MSNLYEVIEALRRWKGYSMRELAERAEIPHTSLASIMSRRSSKISVNTLESIANVFNKEAHNLYTIQSVLSRTPNSVMRVSTELSEEDMKSILSGIIGENYAEYLPPAESDYERSINHDSKAKVTLNYGVDVGQHFRQSIIFMLNKLNEDGLMEAMRRVLEVAQDSRYCLHNSTNDLVSKQDDLA